MPISNRDKLNLLRDLLQNQAIEQFMTTDEATQIERLLTTLSIDSTLSASMLQTLQEMQQQHQVNHQPFQQQNVEQWLNIIERE